MTTWLKSCAFFIQHGLRNGAFLNGLFLSQVRCIERLRDDCQDSESARFDILTGIDAILTNLLVEDKGDCRSAPKLAPTKGVQFLSEEVDCLLA